MHRIRGKESNMAICNHQLPAYEHLIDWKDCNCSWYQISSVKSGDNQHIPLHFRYTSNQFFFVLFQSLPRKQYVLRSTKWTVKSSSLLPPTGRLVVNNGSSSDKNCCNGTPTSPLYLAVCSLSCHLQPTDDRDMGEGGGGEGTMGLGKFQGTSRYSQLFHVMLFATI